MYRTSQAGALIVLVLVFGAVFFIIVVSFMGFVLTQHRVQAHKLQSEKALAIAEGGLNYYKWYLAHFPGDYTHGTGGPGPYEIPYEDFESGLVGTSTLEISEQSYCGDVVSLDIHSTGVSAEKPSLERTVFARYALPSVAEYAYIINSDVWAGPSRVITGPYHSNGGVRMDGTNNSTVTSGVQNWICDNSFGCDPVDNAAEGVFGAGANSTLWKWPVPGVDFERIDSDIQEIETIVQNWGSGDGYIGESGRSGYRIVFQDDGTYNLYMVRDKENEPQGNAYGYHLNKIKNTQYLGNQSIDPACPVIFVDDNVWLEGEVSGKITLVAASGDGTNPRTIVLQDNITYVDEEEDALLVMSDNDILLGFDVPDDMVISGIFVAQGGHFGRNDYSWLTTPASWQQYVFRNSLTINGTIVSKGRVGTQWVYSNGNPASGFMNREAAYDRRLVLDPPPLTPRVSDNYTFIEWRQE